MAADPVAFATARLNEDEREIRNDPPVGMGYAILPVRMLRDLKAGRRILARHAECAERGTGPCREFPVGDGALCAELADLLYRWADHGDYDRGWKP